MSFSFRWRFPTTYRIWWGFLSDTYPDYVQCILHLSRRIRYPECILLGCILLVSGAYLECFDFDSLMACELRRICKRLVLNDLLG